MTTTIVSLSPWQAEHNRNRCQCGAIADAIVTDTDTDGDTVYRVNVCRDHRDRYL